MGLSCSKFKKQPLENNNFREEIFKNFGVDINKIDYNKESTLNPIVINGSRYILSQR